MGAACNLRLSITITTSASVRQQKSQLGHRTAQLSLLSIGLAPQLEPKPKSRSESVEELYAKYGTSTSMGLTYLQGGTTFACPFARVHSLYSGYIGYQVWKLALSRPALKE